MQSSTLVAGDPVQARCTKCRKNTDHLIVTMAEEAPIKVQCNACSRQHKYRPPTAGKKPALQKTVNHREAGRKEWEAMRPGMDKAEATAYSMNKSYKANALIDHPVFGLGIVQRVVGGRKVEVLFEDGRKMMRCL